MAELLNVQDLRVHFHIAAKGRNAVDGVSFSLEEGEILGLVGESGSGKSVTAMSISGLLPRRQAEVSGSIKLGGREILQCPEEELRKIQGDDLAVVFQEPMTSLNPVLRIGPQVEESLRVHARLSPEARRQRALEAMIQAELPDPESLYRKYPHELSGGMLQRVMIASAIISGPKLLLADEPTTALDVTIQDQIMKLLNQLKQELGMSIILVTHDLGVIAQMCDRVAVMYAGQIVEMTDTVTLFSRPRHPYTYGLMGSLPNEETAGTTLEAIKGSPPNLAHLPEGCPFSPRCKYACDLCRRERPALTEVEPGHLARCHRLDVTASFQGLIEVPDGAGRKEDTPHG